jgi:hypothetical protein
VSCQEGLAHAGDVATGLCPTCPRRDVRGRFLIGWVRSARERPRVVAPAMAATGGGKDASGHEKIPVCGQLAPGARSSEFPVRGHEISW